MVRWVVGLVLVVALAGCADAASDAGQPAASPDLQEAVEAAQQAEVQATAKTGVIRGVVVDEALRPLPGVLVEVDALTRNQTTNDQGVFAFQDVAPGSYLITASLAEYGTVKQAVDVVAGVDNPEAVKILLTAIPRATPFIEAHQVKLFVSASVWVESAVSTGLTLGGNGVLSEAGSSFLVEIQPNGTLAQSELNWEATSPLANQARTAGGTYRGTSTFDIAILHGPSPIVKRSNATTEEGTADSVRHNFYAWPSTAVPAGVLVNQEINAFVHVFHNFHPDADWIFSRDGEHPIPAR